MSEKTSEPEHAEGESSSSNGSEQKSVVYGYRKGPFRAIEDLIEIVANPDLDRVSSQPPFRPKASEIYVYECEQRYMDKRLWTYDGYRWRNNGKHKYPKPTAVFEKVYFNMENPADIDMIVFRRCAYIPLGKKYKYMVVQYLGSECTSSTGNTVSASWEPNRSGFQLTPTTSDPVLQECDISLLGSHFTLTPISTDETGTLQESSSKTVHSLSSRPAPQPSTSGSRKRSFVLVAKDTNNQNNCSAVRRRPDVNETDVWVDERGKNVFRFSKRTFSDIMNICFEMRSNNCFWSFSSSPDLVLMFGCCELLDDLMDLLSSTDDQVQVLIYSTSPCLDGFYVSVLSFLHPMFTCMESDNSPAVIPLAFMIHQNNSSSTHSALFSIIQDHLSAIPSENIVSNLAIVSDRNSAVMIAIKKSLPNSINLLSLAHIKKEGECWLTKNMHSKRGSRYLADVEDMMKATSRSEFDCFLKNHKESCSRSWLNFFEINLQEDLISHNNNWTRVKDNLLHQNVLEQHQSPALEQVLDDLEQHHDATMDKLVQSLYLLQQFYIKELKKGRCGMGTFRLTEKYMSQSVDPQFMKLDESVVPPAHIVRVVMKKTDIIPDTSDQDRKIQIKQETENEDDDSNSILVVTKNFSDVEDEMDADAVVLDMQESKEGISCLSPDTDMSSVKYRRKY